MVQTESLDSTPQEFEYDLSALGLEKNSVLSTTEGKFYVTPFGYYPLAEIVLQKEANMYGVFVREKELRKLATISEPNAEVLQDLISSLTDKRDASSNQDSPTIEFAEQVDIHSENDRRHAPYICFDN